ncbi:MAG: hypothetical protein XU11_C0003G0082 [Candidatus Dadabacteria bacterium CSP1-2]|nr:MAG: hypothetical protein XU11_C0003G0082 [Candidatus Dadabacteria bacterium CSP1-2]
MSFAVLHVSFQYLIATNRELPDILWYRFKAAFFVDIELFICPHRLYHFMVAFTLIVNHCFGGESISHWIRFRTVRAIWLRAPFSSSSLTFAQALTVGCSGSNEISSCRRLLISSETLTVGLVNSSYK